jgi:hypothetical protein
LEPTNVPTNVPTVTPEPTLVPTPHPTITQAPPTDTPTPTIEPTNTPTPTPTATEAPSGYTIDYDFSKNAQSGDFSITVNGISVVSVTSVSSGQITVPENANIFTSVGAGASSQLIASVSLIIYNAGTEIYNDVAEGTPFAGDSYNYTATGNGTISASSSEY